MHRYLVSFSQVSVGAEFNSNGNKYRKRSTRTADLLEYNRWFYFRQNEEVEVTSPNMLNHK